MNRYYVVLTSGNDGLRNDADLGDLATWIDIRLGKHDVESTVYASIEDMLADRADKQGAWELDDHPQQQPATDLVMDD